MYDWPWFGLALAAVLFPLLLRARPHDARWLAGLVWPVYALHQFEEHGIDALGRHYAFQAEMCRVLGHLTVAGCPATPAFLFSVNVGAVWLDGLFALVVARRRPVLALAVLGIPLVNAVVHLGAGIGERAYNPGLVSAVLLLAPYSVFTLRRAFAERLLVSKLQLVPIVLGGVAVHGVLVGSALLADRGVLGQATLCAVQVANGLVPMAAGLVAERIASQRAPEISAA